MRKSVSLAEHVDEEREYLMRRAPNAIEWAVDKRFCNQQSLYKHWGAYKLVKEFFELRCPHCNEGEGAVPADPWGLSPETLGAEVLLVWTPKHEDDACPKCGITRTELVESGILHNYRILASVIGQRAGKSSTLALVGTYVEHVLLTLAHSYPGGLAQYFGSLPGEPLHITYVASTDTQSKETIWAKYRGYRLISPWFGRYVPWAKDQEKLQETPKGMQPLSYSEHDKTIDNQLAHLSIDSLNSNSNGLAGRTRVAAFIDEICRMEQTDSSKSAQEVYRTMDASVQTIQGNVEQFGLIPWMGMICSVSSPKFEDDYGMQLLKMAQGNSKMYAVHLATWEFNPWLPFEFFADMLKKDYVGTMRNFGARPPGAATPLVDRPQDFKESAVDMTLKPTATFSSYAFEDGQGRSMLGVRLERADLILRSTPRFIAVDAGKNFDAFAVACAHGEADEEGNITTVYDWVIRLLTSSRKQEVYFESFYELLKEVTKFMVIKQIEFDHWNSFPLVQRIRQDLGMLAEERTTDPHHFIQFLRDGYSGRIKLLPATIEDATLSPQYMSAQGALIYELLHLDRDPKTDKVFNARKGLVRGVDSDDTARVAVHVHRLVQDQGYTERQDDTSRRARHKRAQVAIAQWSSEGRGQVYSPGQNSRNSSGRGSF